MTQQWQPPPLIKGEMNMGAARDARALRAQCYDCGLPYDDPGFCDFVVPHDIWAKISPTGHDGGLLCPTCMCRRAVKAGLDNVPGKFTSGPFASEAKPASETRGTNQS